MSSQLDFIMQLYMMNLLQQQQQQQQRQHESQHHQILPTDQKCQNTTNNTTTKTTTETTSLSSGTKTTIAPASTTTLTTTIATATAAATTTTTKIDLESPDDENSLKKQPNQRTGQSQTEQNQKQIENQNTKRSDNSESINCSNSSSSCSPNSKFRNNLSEFLTSSPNKTKTTTSMTTFNPLQQLLFNQLSPENLIAQSLNVPLTPTTPNSQMLDLPFNSNSKLTKTGDLALKNITDLFIAGIGGNNDLSNTNHNNNNNTNNTNDLYQLTQNPNNMNNFNNSQFSAEQFLQSSTVTSTPTEKSPLPQGDISTVGEKYVVGTIKQMKVEGSISVDEEDVEEEDDKPLSSLYNSSGAASTSTGSGETSSKLLMSGFQTLESTSDSYESLNAPYTPIKQSADSSISSTMALFKDTQLLTRFACENDDVNVTPMVHANVLPTPPSSEQLISKKFEAGGTFTSQNTNTFSSSDNLLTNEENLKNLRKVSSYLECENPLCRQENLREHFHCHEEPCQGKILSKKDDIIRHLKWHKKRKESLLLGFARFTSSDDCATEYGANCTYNWKQTHYHCIYEDCPKVYVSTSDVQMHSNFHRKNTEIVQEGFRRFRAHENCKIQECPFYGKKISHYHCCREGCNHTFKNKADMEKHKTYHLKDFQLTQDGFKKILKTEPCPFEACKFSTVCNHIHCVREGCNYILHSSSQMISHKRKHDRLDSEQAYQTFKKEKDSSEEESTPPVPTTTHSSTPLSSLSAEHFLSRKRGRPPKKIQMPTATETNGGGNSKRTKTDNNEEQNSVGPSIFGNFPPGMYPPFLANFNTATAAMAAQNMPSDPNVPNFQLTHLMALFQLQNPLFYQNMYPGGVANMANMLNAAFGNSGTFNNASNGQGSNVKSEFTEQKPQFKE